MIQAEGANVSASASAEANAVKVSGNTLELNIGGGEKRFPDNILRALNPAWYERREAKAREIKADSLKKTVDTLLEGCPAMTRQRAVMEAMGYSMTNEQAENFAAVSSRASDIVKEACGTMNPVLPETRDHIVDGASHAYEDDARELWGRILAGELNKPGSFSKRTLAILSGMEKREAESFMKLCSYSTGIVAKKGEKYVLADNPTPVLAKDPGGASYNGGAISLTDLSALDSLGLIDQSLLYTKRFLKGIPFPFLAKDALVIAENNGPDNRVDFTGAIFRAAGLELSRICSLGCAPDLADILSDMLEKNGIKATITPFSTDGIGML